ncbi:hypothetical protein EJ05DRAFT_59786 [Pseudovirgaria hyperparasitica]|uniref:Uncharacterized protein n=1 Tax=Pseudovirgaria hyperparasitica TaxID=470096 RepID=A0A6A6W6P7_9PEZI|nr:uncharacterized protein EJ05DRAFT_59786 [Pseudovirgaria hyperparasitica]KAF2757237.1 hypothetical protein EJ05DRAFT_59786 [Pseudovirgaria hyperparasitica]
MHAGGGDKDAFRPGIHTFARRGVRVSLLAEVDEFLGSMHGGPSRTGETLSLLRRGMAWGWGINRTECTFHVSFGVSYGDWVFSTDVPRCTCQTVRLSDRLSFGRETDASSRAHHASPGIVVLPWCDVDLMGCCVEAVVSHLPYTLSFVELVHLAISQDGWFLHVRGQQHRSTRSARCYSVLKVYRNAVRERRS